MLYPVAHGFGAQRFFGKNPSALHNTLSFDAGKQFSQFGKILSGKYAFAIGLLIARVKWV